MTLDQLRAFVAVVEEGSFSAAARRLRRVQSAVSTSMANLEEQLGVSLFNRTTKIAKLTPHGQAVLAAARRVLAEVDALRTLASGMARGLEAQVSLCLDALFPLEALLPMCTAFAAAFPTVDLRVDTQVLSAVSARVLGGSATLGVVTPPGLLPGLEHRRLGPIRMIPVVSPRHPLAERAPVSAQALAGAIQIVLSERREDGVPDQAVLSPRTWRVADLHTKHMMLREGLGWGNLPEHLARGDLRAKKLVAIRVPGLETPSTLPLFAVYRGDTVLGPAHRWLLAELAVACRANPSSEGTNGRGRRREAGAKSASDPLSD